MAKDQIPGLRVAVEPGEAVTALPRRVEKLAVVREREVAAHSTSTSRSLAAASARSSAARFVVPVAST